MNINLVNNKKNFNNLKFMITTLRHKYIYVNLL